MLADSMLDNPNLKAFWVNDLEKMRSFYCEVLGGISNEIYENTTKNFQSP